MSLVGFDHWSAVRIPRKMPSIAFQPPIFCQPILFAVVVLGWLLAFWVPKHLQKNSVFWSIEYHHLGLSQIIIGHILSFQTLNIRWSLQQPRGGFFSR